ncbi:MAG: hypothetical protein FWD42_02470 [Solirubrobacterales bacterium]|nr:hypothetical protein [Solirubrobacterales bacterium]
MGTRVEMRFAKIGRDAHNDAQEIFALIRSFENAVSAHKQDSFCARLALEGEAYFKNDEEKSFVYPMLREALALALPAPARGPRRAAA